MHLEPIFIPCYLLCWRGRNRYYYNYYYYGSVHALSNSYLFVAFPFSWSIDHLETRSHILSYVLSNTQRKRGRRIIWHLIPSRFSLALSVLLKYIYMRCCARSMLPCIVCFLSLFIAKIFQCLCVLRHCVMVIMNSNKKLCSSIYQICW